MPALFDPDTAPAALLPVFADWLGLEIEGGFLSEQQCRQLIKSGFRLMSRKGTRAAIEEIVHLLVEEPVYILERVGPEGRREQNGEDPFAFTVLIARQSDEQLHAKLLYLIDQFRPIRTRAVSYTHLDVYKRQDQEEGQAAAIPILPEGQDADEPTHEPTISLFDYSAGNIARSALILYHNSLFDTAEGVSINVYAQDAFSGNSLADFPVSYTHLAGYAAVEIAV